MKSKLKSFGLMSLVCFMVIGSASAYAYQYGVDWRGPYSDSVSGGYCNHSITWYEMEYLNGTYRIKASTSHSKSSKSNYTRCRYETVFGEIYSGSDTGRKYSANGTSSKAEVPSSINGGYVGIRKVYVGTDGY